MTSGAIAERARATYDAARDHFDAAPLRFWERYGKRTVARARLQPGARVLDVCSGTGASARAAARAVGPLGKVVAVDLSAPLLERAAEKAAREGLENFEVRVADMTAIDFPPDSFDAVFVVFGIFFAPDMSAQVRALARLLRPGGKMAVTTWGPRLFEPLYSELLDEVRARRPGLDEFRPWDRVTSPEELASVLREGGLRSIEIASEQGQEPLDAPADWWTIVLGTGLRWFVDILEDDEAESLRETMLERARRVRAVETNVIYAVGEK